MNNRENTQHIAQLKDNTIDVTQIIGQVYEALTEKGYNPVSQLVGLYYEWRSYIYHQL